jgi:hypothetical protein
VVVLLPIMAMLSIKFCKLLVCRHSWLLPPTRLTPMPQDWHSAAAAAAAGGCHGHGASLQACLPQNERSPAEAAGNGVLC